jgi:hypothetical protein
MVHRELERRGFSPWAETPTPLLTSTDGANR